MECWWAQPSSHDGSVHVYSRARWVSGTQLMAAGWDLADLQNQLDGIVKACSHCSKNRTAFELV